MSGVQPVNFSPFANDLRTIFDKLTYGPAPEADNVAQVTVHFKCHAFLTDRLSSSPIAMFCCCAQFAKCAKQSIALLRRP